MNLKEKIKLFNILINPWYKYAKKLIILCFFGTCICLPLSEYFAVIIPEKVLAALETESTFMEIFIIAIKYALLSLTLSLCNRGIHDFYFDWKSNAVIEKIERDIFNNVLQIDQSNFNNPNYLDAYKLTTEEFSKKSVEAFENVFKCISSIIRIFLFGAVITLKGTYIIFLVILFSLFATSAQIVWSKVSAKKNIDGVRHRRKIDYIRRLFFDPEVVEDIKISRIYSKLESIFNDGYKNTIKIHKKYAKSVFGIDSLIVISKIGINFIIPLYIAQNIINKELFNISIFSTLLISSDALKSTLNEFGWWSAKISQEISYAQQVKNFFEYDSSIENNNEGYQLIEGSIEVQMEKISFKYPGSDFKVNIDKFEVNKGEKVAIVGDNGAGKSTLIKLLLRLYDLNAGYVYINNKNIKEYSTQTIRKSIGYVSQKPMIYAISIKDYIDINGDEENNVNQLLDFFCFKERTEKILTKEFEEDGIVLSEGNKQILALARVLKKNYGLLLLDEPSSALDPIKEEKMISLIENISTTTIIIAHRLSAIKNLDKIFVMENGKIVESGKHQELINKKGKYYQMYSVQSKRYQ
ncbi:MULTISPECIES: ABC transporter ATP-binding protein [Terrabacteria group]|uniref:ATP-binding cassette domain-containing protein n=1 Tax=Bacillati TaxID=1783272 RepID=UPI001C6F2D16|nr:MULTISPECIES: ABC transporter ATP-binding protein [Terrabacteria group]MBW9211905.1 ABC transporter ATP-binding protein/permease [Trueperella sp. zg.1013]